MEVNYLLSHLLLLLICISCLPNSEQISSRNSRVNNSTHYSSVGLRRILPKDNENPLAHLTTPQVISYYGYPAESHNVVTKDGYILTMHRIPYGKGQRSPRNKERRPIVFLQHGLFASSYEWLMNRKDNLLPLRLVDAGYDVWFGNARGNAYSRGHLNLTAKNEKFWEFSMNEMGKYDLPAEIDFVLAHTGQAKLSYVGFSMGTSMFFTLMSHHPEYNDKVKLMTALAPVVYLNHIEMPLKVLSVMERFTQLKNLIQRSTNGEFLPPWTTAWYNSYWTRICSNKLVAREFCSRVLFLYSGWDKPQVLINQLPLFFSHTPSPMSVRSIMHLLQFFHSGVFQEYDFGYEENIKRYGKATPPKYSLKNARVPVALLYGKNDAIVNPVDVKRLARELPNVVLHSPVNFEYWNHFDYHLGKDSNLLVNDRIIKLLGQYR